MANYIVTGGSGFIGHNVVRQLEALGHKCHVIDIIENYSFIPKDELKYLHHERNKRMRAIVHHINITDRLKMETLFSALHYEIDGVIHLASFPRQKMVERFPHQAAEVMGTALIDLLELTVRYHIPKFVYISSSMVYGDFFKAAREDDRCNPIGQYAIMKLMGEQLVEDYSRRKLIEHVIVRPSAVYGEWDVEDRVVSKFILAALRGDTLEVHGPNERLDFTHVDDCAAGIVLATTTPSAVNQTINISRGRARTLLEAAETAIEVVGKGTINKVERDKSYPRRDQLALGRASFCFNYEPKIDIYDGFTRYAEWFKISPYWGKKLGNV